MVLTHTAPIENMPLELVETPIPEPNQKQIRIKIASCGICHTDLDEIERRLQTELPIVPGHHPRRGMSRRTCSLARRAREAPAFCASILSPSMRDLPGLAPRAHIAIPTLKAKPLDGGSAPGARLAQGLFADVGREPTGPTKQVPLVVAPALRDGF